MCIVLDAVKFLHRFGGEIVALGKFLGGRFQGQGLATQLSPLGQGQRRKFFDNLCEAHTLTVEA